MLAQIRWFCCLFFLQIHQNNYSNLNWTSTNDDWTRSLTLWTDESCEPRGILFIELVKFTNLIHFSCGVYFESDGLILTYVMHIQSSIHTRNTHFIAMFATNTDKHKQNGRYWVTAYDFLASENRVFSSVWPSEYTSRARSERTMGNTYSQLDRMCFTMRTKQFRGRRPAHNNTYTLLELFRLIRIYCDYVNNFHELFEWKTSKKFLFSTKKSLFAFF